MGKCLWVVDIIEKLFSFSFLPKAQSLLRISFLIICFSTNYSTLSAQQVIISTGGSISSSTSSVSYSVGHLFYKLQVESNNSVTEEIHQPEGIGVVTRIPAASGIDLFLLAYPNPAKDFLYLKVEGESLNNLSYQMYDLKGKMLENKEICNKITFIALDNYVSSTYLLKVLQDRRELMIFRIIKN